MSQQEDRFDAAMSRRLAQLGAMPMDTSRLEKAVRGQIGAPASGHDIYWRKKIYRSVAAVAASLIFVALIGMAFLQNRTAQASSDMMLQLHRDMVAGKISVMPVDSVAEVNQAFATFGHGGMKIEAPAMHVMTCCLKNVGSKEVYCVQLKEKDMPVTLTIADLDAVASLPGAPVMHHGEAFHVTSADHLNMVTLDRGHFRICLIGEMSPEQLMSLTDDLKL